MMKQSPQSQKQKDQGENKQWKQYQSLTPSQPRRLAMLLTSLNTLTTHAQLQELCIDRQFANRKARNQQQAGKLVSWLSIRREGLWKAALGDASVADSGYSLGQAWASASKAVEVRLRVSGPGTMA